MNDYGQRHMPAAVEALVLCCFLLPQVLRLWKRLIAFRSANWKRSNPDAQKRSRDQQRSLLQSQRGCCMESPSTLDSSMEQGDLLSNRLAQQSRKCVCKDLLGECCSALSMVFYYCLVPGHMPSHVDVPQQSFGSLVLFGCVSVFFILICLTTDSNLPELIEWAWGRTLRSNRGCLQQVVSVLEGGERSSGMLTLILKFLDVAWPWLVKLVTFPLLCTYQTHPPHVISMASISCWDNQTHWFLVFTSALALQALLSWQLGMVLRKCSWPTEGPGRNFEGIWQNEAGRMIKLDFCTDENGPVSLMITNLSPSRQSQPYRCRQGHEQYTLEAQLPLRDSVCNARLITAPMPEPQSPQELEDRTRPLVQQDSGSDTRQLNVSIHMQLIINSNSVDRRRLIVTQGGRTNTTISSQEQIFIELVGDTWYHVAFLRVPFLQDPVIAFFLTLLKVSGSMLWSAFSHQPRRYSIPLSAGFLTLSLFSVWWMRMSKFSIFEFVNKIMMLGTLVAALSSLGSLVWAITGHSSDLAWTKLLHLSLSAVMALAVVLPIMFTCRWGMACFKRLDIWSIGDVGDIAKPISLDFAQWCVEHEELLRLFGNGHEACLILNNGRPCRILAVRQRVEPFTLSYSGPVEGEPAAEADPGQWWTELQSKLRQMGLDLGAFDVYTHAGEHLGDIKKTTNHACFPLQFIPKPGTYSEFQDWEDWLRHGKKVVAAIKGASSVVETSGSVEDGNELEQLERQVNPRKRVVKEVAVWITNGGSSVSAMAFTYADGGQRTFGRPRGERSTWRLPDNEYLASMSIYVENGKHVSGCSFETNGNGPNSVSTTWGWGNARSNLKTFKAVSSYHIVDVQTDRMQNDNLIDATAGIILAYIPGIHKQQAEFEIKVAQEWLPMPSLASRHVSASRLQERRGRATPYNLEDDGQRLMDVKARVRAIVFGDAGSGKSTLLSALCNFALANDGFVVQEQSSGVGVTTKTTGVEHNGRLYLDMPGMENSENDLAYLQTAKERLGFESKENPEAWFINHFILTIRATENRFVRLEQMLVKLRQHFGVNVPQLLTIVFTNAGACRTESQQNHVLKTFKPFFQKVFGNVEFFSASDHQSNESNHAVNCVFIDTLAALPDQEHHFAPEDRILAHNALRKVEELIDFTQNQRFSTHVWPPVVRDYLDLKVTYEEGDKPQSLKPLLLAKGSSNQKWTLSTQDGTGSNIDSPLGICEKTGNLYAKTELQAGHFSLTVEVKVHDEKQGNSSVPRISTHHTTLDVALNKKHLEERLQELEDAKHVLTCEADQYNKLVMELDLELRETREAIELIRQRKEEIKDAAAAIVERRAKRNAEANDFIRQLNEVQKAKEKVEGELNETQKAKEKVEGKLIVVEDERRHLEKYYTNARNDKQIKKMVSVLESGRYGWKNIRSSSGQVDLAALSAEMLQVLDEGSGYDKDLGNEGVSNTLAAIGEPAISAVSDGLRRYKKWVVLKECALACYKIGPSASRCTPELIKELVKELVNALGYREENAVMTGDADNGAIVRGSCVRALSKFGGQLETSHIQRLKQVAKTDASIEVRIKAMVSLGILNVIPVSDVVEFLIEMGRNGETLAMIQLGDMGEAPERAIQMLIGNLKRSDANCVCTAASALVKLGRAKEGLAALQAVLDENNRRHWTQAVKELGSLGVAAKPAIPKLISCLSNKNPFFTCHVAVALVRLGCVENSVEKLKAILESGGPDQKSIVVNELGSLGFAAEPLIPTLRVMAANDEDCILRENARQCLESLGFEPVGYSAQGTAIAIKIQWERYEQKNCHNGKGGQNVDLDADNSEPKHMSVENAKAYCEREGYAGFTYEPSTNRMWRLKEISNPKGFEEGNFDVYERCQWAHYEGKNCYDGKGGQNVDLVADNAEAKRMSVEDAKAYCAREGYVGFTYEPSTNRMWRLKEISNPKDFEGGNFDVYQRLPGK